MKKTRRSNKMKNSEILLITEAKNTNPNGDPQNENMPRFDEEGKVEITDLRLKRYIRDYISSYVSEHNVAVKPIPEVKETKISSLLINYVENLKETYDGWEDMKDKEKEEVFLQKYIDIPLFGLVTGSEKKKKDENNEISFLKPNYYGTIQFQYGYSLNHIRREKDIQVSPVTGTFGKDYRIQYGAFGFYGVVNGLTADKYNEINPDLMTTSMMKEFDEWIIKSIPLISAQSRSKIGQDVLFYMRIEYVDGNLPQDLRDFVLLEPNKEIFDAKDFIISVDKLHEHLKDKDISTMRVYKSRKATLSKSFDEFDPENIIK
ncbi:hypothetical protein GF327_01875 [Candidatus Woesearchaeota archaeon]|nr:hypothetical protein [Candidatus Woesearchaeota archaeon]